MRIRQTVILEDPDGNELAKVQERKLSVPFWEAEAEDQDYLQRYPDGYTFFPRPDSKPPDRETAP
jgi:peptide methionine sulfoxide reductase MsrA